MLEISIRIQADVAEAIRQVVQEVIRTLNTPPQARFADEDKEMQEWWMSSLSESMREDGKALLRFVEDKRFGRAKIQIAHREVELLLRACSLVRLHIWKTVFGEASEEKLEEMIRSPETIEREQRPACFTYMMLAHLQEKVVDWMEGHSSEDHTTESI